MKKIASFLLFALTLTGCYKDKGNYEYTLGTMNEIQSVTFSPAVSNRIIEVQQALDESGSKCRIEAIVEQSLAQDLDNLEFYWNRTYVNPQGVQVKDTIRTKGYLEVDLPIGKPMSYGIFLEIYDKSTDLSHYSKFTIATRPIFKNSLFVLHGGEGERKIGNIEVIGSETKTYTDVKAVTRDNNLYKNATGFGYTTYWNIPIDGSPDGATNVLTVYGNNGETKAYNPHGMNVRFTAEQIIKPNNQEFTYLRTMQTGDPSNGSQCKVVLTENGEAYVGNYVHALYKPGAGCENNPDLPHQSDYKITAATITGNRFLMWDAKHGRFLYSAKNDGGFAKDEGSSIDASYVSMNALLDAHVKFVGLQKSPADMTAVMGYINYRDNYDQQNAFFIFKDEATGEYYRYELLKLEIGDGSKVNGRRGVDGEQEILSAYSIVSEKHLAGLTPTDMSTITYNSWFTTSNLFFAKGNTVYRYNVSNGDSFIVYEAPEEGYEVTKMKFRAEESSAFSVDLGLYLDIVLFDGTNGAIAEIKFTTASDVDEDYTPRFYDKDDEGNSWGEIKDIQFVYDYLYKQIYEDF